MERKRAGKKYNDEFKKTIVDLYIMLETRSKN